MVRVTFTSPKDAQFSSERSRIACPNVRNIRIPLDSARRLGHLLRCCLHLLPVASQRVQFTPRLQKLFENSPVVRRRHALVAELPVTDRMVRVSQTARQLRLREPHLAPPLAQISSRHHHRRRIHLRPSWPTSTRHSHHRYLPCHHRHQLERLRCASIHPTRAHCRRTRHGSPSLSPAPHLAPHVKLRLPLRLVRACSIAEVMSHAKGQNDQMRTNILVAHGRWRGI